MALRTKGLIGKRYFTIGFFGVIMLISISIQLFFPLLPLYSMGCMLGTALLRTFIIENEKEEYRINLEEEYKKEQQQSQELKTAWEVAYTDALTGAKSKLAYLEAIESIDKSIYKEELKDFAIVAFDINNLKEINDTYGHQAGDEYIKSAYELIKDVFKNSSIFRIGGDEFIVILEKDDYINRVDLVNKFNNMIEDNARNKKIVIASGLTDYDPKLDKTLRHIIERADFLMYDKKKKLKEIINNNEKALL
ncbi:MAG: GGDEF domain-containing protein [Acholeplasmatales bacterium]|nr:GGDEF domain-containing protein [Acholeplasmatales bacterium]